MNQLTVKKCAEKVHEAWIKDSLEKGFHAPNDCDQAVIIDKVYATRDKYAKLCSMCQPNMYPFDEMPDTFKEWRYEVVGEVLKAVYDIGLREWFQNEICICHDGQKMVEDIETYERWIGREWAYKKALNEFDRIFGE
jgi:hypothetical protein